MKGVIIFPIGYVWHLHIPSTEGYIYKKSIESLIVASFVMEWVHEAVDGYILVVQIGRASCRERVYVLV